MKHTDIWNAIEKLAQNHNLSLSGLAKKAGLDPTIFNKSKRKNPQGKERWLSTSTIAQVLKATDSDWQNIAQYMNKDHHKNINIPLIGMAQAGQKGFFDDAGYPVGQGWDEINFPTSNAYALEISGDSMLPIYRDGDIIIVMPEANFRRGDRVVVKTIKGEVMVKELIRKTTKRIILASANKEYEDVELNLDDVEWIVRILWASQ